MTQHPPNMSNTGRPPVHPHSWREIINGSLEENFVSMALGTFNELIKINFIPTMSREHIQLLLYLTTGPVDRAISKRALNILHKLLSLHQPSSISQALPFHPSASKSKEDTPVWLQWDYKRSDLHKSVWKRMKECLDEGIWALLWEYRAKDATDIKKRKHRGDIDDDTGDYEEEGDRKRKVSENGWNLLGWLIEFWEKDKLENSAGQIGYSPLFMKQLPRPFDRSGQLPRNDASVPLFILKSACTFTGLGSSETRDSRIALAVKLLSLVIDATSGPIPPFHPESLSSSILHTLQSHSTSDVQRIIKGLETLGHWRASTHILTLLIESLGATRNMKMQDRKAKHQFEYDSQYRLNRPDIRYLLQQILLTSSKENNEQSKICIYKVQLLRIITTHRSQIGNEEEMREMHRIRDDSRWWADFDRTNELEMIDLKRVLESCIKSFIM
ncbi:uncharacterized protein I206_103807 [Kwoniella pini CBS 10737]|uniref:Uncharacterized protein n=1 Tax=Kwoniella pini CBS 10737 TaxID=1296096 RepID=A0AAJ8L3E3_9TREE